MQTNPDFFLLLQVTVYSQEYHSVLPDLATGKFRLPLGSTDTGFRLIQASTFPP